MAKNLKSFLIRSLIMAAIILILCFFAEISNGNLYQIMDNLDYNITLNEDGSMSVVETWDIYVSHTNTLFRTFNKSNNYGKIYNVNVKDLNTGKSLTQIDEEMYHVTKDCFYALDINSRDFEVAWGVGMDNKKGRRKYEFSYTVSDVITTYKDCQEFYWKLLDESNGIPVKRITGTINLPAEVENTDNLKVWGHGPIQGDIKKTSNSKIEFSVDSFSKNRMLELRVVSLENLFNSSDFKQRNYNYLETILNEEDKWATEANESTNDFYYTLEGIYIIFVIINIIVFIRYFKISKRKNDGLVHSKLEYYREIPRENATPAEALYIYGYNKDGVNDITSHQSNVVSAIILNLAYKKYISLQVKNEEVYIKILKGSDGLGKDELAIYKLIKRAGSKNEEFEIGNLNKFARKDYYQYSNLISDMVNNARESIYEKELVDKANEKKYLKCKRAKSIYIALIWIIQFLIIGFLIGLIPWLERTYICTFGVRYKLEFLTHFVLILPVLVTFLIQLKIKSKAQPKIAVLTQKGLEEQEKWKGLYKYIKDYSLIKEKEILSLAIWEKYLIYATAFGIASKAIDQMKSSYPNIFVEEYWSDEKIKEYAVCNFILSNVVYKNIGESPISIINHQASAAYKISQSEIATHSSSSGGGGGGGFSGGGGGRWRRRPEWAEDK